MESCDTNLLLHAINSSDPLHAAAAGYLQSKVADERFVICELALAELYVLLRNPRILARPLEGSAAVEVIQSFRRNPRWRVLDYPGGLMEQVWSAAGRPAFPRGGIYDARLAFTLRHYGVKRFATRNTRHFQEYGFDEVFDPTV